MECVFCRIIAGELPSKKVYEDEGFVAFHDIRPKAPVHVLVVPKEHVEKLSDYPDTESMELLASEVMPGFRRTDGR